MLDLARSNSILTSRASVQAVQIAEGLRFASLQDAISQIRGSNLPGDLEQHFIDLLTERANGALRSAADVLASEALALGRYDEATVFKEDIQEATYTALLDDNTCDPCAEADGTTVEFGSAEYERLSPPYRECDGGLRCRCQFVFTLKTEAPGGPVPITPLRPFPPFPPIAPAGPFPPSLPTPVTPRVAPPAPKPAPLPPPVPRPTPPVVPPRAPIVPPRPPVVPPPAPVVPPPTPVAPLPAYVPLVPAPITSMGIETPVRVPTMPVLPKKADAMAWLDKRFPGLEARKVTTANTGAVQEGFTELNRLAATYPNVARTFKGIGTTPNGGFDLQGTARTSAFGTGEYAHVGSFGQVGGFLYRDQQGLGLNPTYWGKPDEIRRLTQIDERQGFHPPGTGTPASVVTHEFGHAIDNYLTWHRDDLLTDGRTVGSVVDRYRPYITGSTTDRGAAYTLRSSISRYAADAARTGGNPEKESFAEAFSSLSWTPEVRLSAPALALRDMLNELDKGGLFR